MSEDTQTVAAVRKVVISNWFDVSQIRVRVTHGVINLQGHVAKIAGENPSPEQMESSLQRLDEGLRAVRGFKGAAYLFDSWMREGTGSWRFAGSRSELEKMRTNK